MTYIRSGTAGRRCRKQNTWRQQLAEYAATYTDLAEELERTIRRELPVDWDLAMQSLAKELQADAKTVASRSASGDVIAKVAAMLPELTGTADPWLNLHYLADGNSDERCHADANYIYYGVREFGATGQWHACTAACGHFPARF